MAAYLKYTVKTQDGTRVAGTLDDGLRMDDMAAAEKALAALTAEGGYLNNMEDAGFITEAEAYEK